MVNSEFSTEAPSSALLSLIFSRLHLSFPSQTRRKELFKAQLWLGELERVSERALTRAQMRRGRPYLVFVSFCWYAYPTKQVMELG